MAFFQLVLKARKVEKARLRYEDEKLRSIESSKGAEPHLTLKQRLRRKKLRYKKKVKHFWSRMISFIRYTWIYKKVRLLRTDGALENYILKSLFGFLGGIFLTYIFFVFFAFQLNFTLSSTTMLCSIFGVILTLGLAFSYRVRCIVFLLLPQFFSKRGRQALMAYAFILTLTGPGKNALYNTSVLSESLACSQEQLKQAVKSVVDLIKQPFYALRDAISKVIKTVKVVVKKIKRTLVAIKRLVLSILRVITSVFQWLGSVVNICNKKLGTPFDRCQRVFEGAVADCKAKLGPLFGGICNLTYIVSALCYIVKPLDFICMLVSYVADAVVDAVRKKIKRFTQHIKAMFYVKVKFSHSFRFETNQSKTMEDVSTDIITEVRSRTDRFLAVFDWMSFMTTFFIIFMLLRVMHYRYRWLTSEKFDNQYLTDDLRTIDLIRTRQEKETILPLNVRERNRYIPLTSVTLIKVEKVKLTKSAVFLGLTTFKICIHMMADYSLYWILSTIRYHGRIETKVQRPNSVGVYVSGNGYLADLYRSIVRAFTPHAKDAEIDVTPCLPDPSPPDLDRYTHIATLIVFCWIMAIFEPYGLRLRHVVMCKYHPERAKQRAVWLYNHIIRSRGSFLKFARRQLRRKFGTGEGERIERITFRERCLAICPFLNKLFPRKQNTCLLCGAVERSDQEPHIKCATPDCIGLFCTQCYADLQNLCTICRSPIEYGDLSDISEEKDSSDDQATVRKEPVLLKEEEDIREEAKEEPRVKEKPEEEAKVDEIPEEILIEREIPEEKEKETDERIVEERKDKAVQTDHDDIDESSSDSIYSYTYQDESPREIEVECRKAPFKDLEAQKIREDITIQIFNDSLAKEITSSSEDPASCFVVRARRKLRTKLKRKSRSSPRKYDSSSSTSIANTESWPTEEVDEEEVIHIEVDDDSKELLAKDTTAKGRKRSRVRRIVAALTKIPWLGKGTKDGRDSDEEWRARRPSLMERIVRMLPGNRSVSPVRTYRRVRTTGTRKDAKRKDSSGSSSSSDVEDERSALLKMHDRQVECLQIPDRDDPEDNIYSRNYDSHRARRRTICRQREPRARIDDVKLKYPHEKKFTTEQLPRYLQCISKDTAYFEVDEIRDSRLRRCIRPGDGITSILHSVNDKDTSRSCTSQCYIEEGSETCQSYMKAATEPSDEASKPEEMSDRELLITNWERLDQGKRMDELVTTEDTSTNIETDREEIAGKVPIRVDRQKSLAENEGAIMKLSSVAEKSNARKHPAKTKQYKKLDTRGRSEASTSRANDEPQLYDPLAGSELYGGVTYQAKRRGEPVEQKVTKEPETEETRIDLREPDLTEYKEDTETMQDMQVVARDVRESAGVLEKSIQTNLRTSDTYEKSDKTSRADAKDSRIVSTEEGGGKKEERKRKKWADKRKRREKSEHDNDQSRGKRQLCTRATLIKEKHLRCVRRERGDLRHRDAQTRERFSECHENLPRANKDRAEWLPDDVRKRGVAASTSKPIVSTTLSEDHRTQCNLGDREDVRRGQDRVSGSKFRNQPEVWSCNVQSQFRAPEQIINYQDHERLYRRKYSSSCEEHIARAPYKCYGETKNAYATEISHRVSSYTNVCSSQSTKMSCTSVGEKPQQRERRKYDVNVRETRLEIPMLKKYLPAYQTPGLIEELKEHDRMRLIQEREARRWIALSALRGTTGSPLCAKSRDRTSCGGSTQCNVRESISRLTSVSTMFTEANDTLPYQETQTFKDMICEFRKRMVEASQRRLISLSQRADECQDLEQLFPPKSEGSTTMSKFDGAINKFKPMYDVHEEECGATQEERGQRFQSGSFESSSIYSYSYGNQRSDISTVEDETADNNDTS